MTHHTLIRQGLPLGGLRILMHKAASRGVLFRLRQHIGEPSEQFFKRMRLEFRMDLRKDFGGL